MTLLTLEALDADDGDCLILHYGTAKQPARILIDGGRSKVYANTLQPHLEALRKHYHLGSTDPLPIELAVLSHVDADHIGGLLALTAKLVEAKTSHEPLPWRIRRLWMNDFDEKLHNNEAAQIQSLAPSSAVEVQAVAASVAQGRLLRDRVTQLAIEVNSEFDSGFAARPDDAVMELELGEVKITVLAPSAAKLKAFEQEWDRALKAILAGQKKLPSTDALVTNAASIVLLVESSHRRILLTGDATSEDILEGLKVAGLLDGKHPFDVDILKVEHHGAEGNCSLELFQSVRARHYVISANGQNGNPDTATLDRLWEARGAEHAEWTLHVTFAADEVPAFRAWCERHPGIRVEHRGAKARSISIELGDERLFA